MVTHGTGRPPPTPPPSNAAVWSYSFVFRIGLSNNDVYFIVHSGKNVALLKNVEEGAVVEEVV